MKNGQDVATRTPGLRTPDAALRSTDSDASTRHRVAQSVLQHGPSTAAALADRLGLTAAAVRRHLDVLQERGLLVAREQRVYGSRGRGRPAKVFALSDEGRNDFYSAYDDLAIAALEFLADEAGSTSVRKFAASRVAPAEARYREALASAEPELSPAMALAGALTGDGYVASVRPSALGEQLCQHHCPVAHVAERFPQLCEVETEMFSRLLGVHVQRLATIAHGDGVCTTHVPATQTQPHDPQRAPHDDPQRAPHDDSQRAPHDDSQRAPHDDSQRAPHDDSQRAPHDDSQRAPHDDSQRAPHDDSQRAPHDDPQRAPHDDPQRAPHDDPQRAPHDDPQRAPHDDPQRAPHDDPRR